MDAQGHQGGGEESKDADILEVLIAGDPRAAAAVSAIRELIENAEFPIADLDALLRAVPKKGLRFREFTMSREQVGEFAPPSVFPIDSEKRLIALTVQAVRQLEPPRYQRVSFEELIAPRVDAEETCS